MFGNDFFWYEALIVLFAGIVHGTLGFGFPMMATPLFALFLDLKKAVLFTLFPTIAVNFLSLKRDNSFGEIWGAYRLLIASVIVGSIVGTNLLVLYDNAYYKLFLAGVILLYLNKERLHISLTHSVAKHPQLMTMLIGFLSGFVGGIANIMIPVLIILILELKLEKKRAIGVMSFCFITNKMLQVLIFGYHGNLNFENFSMILPLIFIAMVGFFIGSRLQDRIDEVLYKKILNFILWILSSYLIVSTFYM
ncbi:sulfite exporter TauE/SafE family protein [Sulfurospirillum barnesii]|uniref:Probable membrane transporter protein n=1 Tax=Sulfurospirillum barnesii (strain ATCC 700032 / DSM 10660 / SES-3) TaxID=760154 RepID=I3XUH3_SULBS|nr:sulfite exporter TauE/SafE family protein [Sulfurospirillum barnesii]AFL67597.1 putative permease [Sulfurospirillum barnesii SES-3]